MEFLKCLCFKNSEMDLELFKQKQIHYGSLNRDKILYYIDEKNKNAGFFAMYRYWMEYIYFADICGYTPVIAVGNDFLYKEEETVLETDNPFEYYFIQPVRISLREAKSSSRVVQADTIHRKMVELVLTGKTNHYKYNKNYLYLMARIVKKYIQFNNHTQEYIDKGIKTLKIDKEKTLGVHIRGTDYRARYNNHPVYITEEDCFLSIDAVLENGKYSRLFVATDDSRILAKFINKYRNIICFYDDVTRSDKNKSVAFIEGERKNHKYLLGLEVIRDMYTLSRCNGLIAGISQVAICAQINKLARGEKYDYLKIIDKGFNNNGRKFGFKN